jgi:MFS family permease
VKLFLDKYVSFVGQPDVARLLMVAVLARMPLGMVGFSMLMFLREHLGSFALAGTAVGINFVAAAIAAPIQGRLIDRQGPRTLLWITGTLQPLALVGILAAVRMGLPFAIVAACAAAAGAFASPLTTLTRTLWRHRFEREEDRRTAFALDAVTIELNFTVGPAIMAAILATAGTTPAFCTAIVVCVAAIVIFAASPALRYFRREAAVERHLLGPLTEPRLWLLFATTFGFAMMIGLLEVGYPAYATALGAPALGGVLLGVSSLGSATGGALYGGLHFRLPVERQFACAMGLMALPILLHALLPPTAILMVLAFFAGALIAPSIAAQSVLVSRLAPPRYATEAFTWGSMCIVSGLGVGMALGGWLVESVGLRSVFITSSVLAGSVALLALLIGAPHPAEAPAAD